MRAVWLVVEQVASHLFNIRTRDFSITITHRTTCEEQSGTIVRNPLKHAAVRVLLAGCGVNALSEQRY